MGPASGSAGGSEQANCGMGQWETRPESELIVGKSGKGKLEVLYKSGRKHNGVVCGGGGGRHHCHSAVSLYRSLKTVLAKMKGLPRRLATDEEVGLDPETRKRHAALTTDFLELTAPLENEGLLSPNPGRFVWRVLQSLGVFLGGLVMSYWLGQSCLVWRALSILLMTVAGGQCLWLGHEGGHNAFTGKPKVDRILQIFSFGFVFGLSASSWNSTHAEHHAMPQHEIKDADLKTLPLIAFSSRIVRKSENHTKFWIHYQHIFYCCVTP